ncbi:imelysin family protein [Roseobacter sp.]|uniref:imelysin family protein n=1 Tax=Roseobacter sp. TaxID=1907202 RepID=UPI003299F4F2
MKHVLSAICIGIPMGLSAGVATVVDEHILPAHSAFSARTADLVTATQTCDTPAMRVGYHAAFDAWMGLSHIQFGPIETEGLTLAITFWPDPKNQTEKAVSRLIAAQDPAVQDDAEFAEVSVAAQGLMALESMLYGGRDQTAYDCALIHAMAVRLAANAQTLEADWRDGHAAVLKTPGADNPRYQNIAEAQRVIYTALSSGLEFLHDQRLGRPLGTFDRPRPKRAEARRSDRSLRNITLHLTALQDLAVALAGADIPKTKAAFLNAINRAESLDDPALQGVADPAERFRIEVLQQAVAGIQMAISEEIGTGLGVRAGFNSLDGD